MPLSAEKLRKLSALSEARPKSPLPEVPKLSMSEEFKARFPDDAGRIEQFNVEMEEFFRRQKTRG